MKNNQSGRSMIEVLCVLGLIGMLAAGALMLVASMYDKYRVSRAGQQLLELQKAINNRYAAQDNYGELDVNELIKEKVLPVDMVVDGKLQHRYGGEVIIRKALHKDKGIQITFRDIPKNACAELLSMNWVVGDYSPLYSIQAGSAKYQWPGVALSVAGEEEVEEVAPVVPEGEEPIEPIFTLEPVASSKSLPIGLAEATGVCKEDNNLTWVFY